MKFVRKQPFYCLVLGTCVSVAAAPKVAVGDLFQFDMVFESDLPQGVIFGPTAFTLSHVVSGTSQWLPDEPFPEFSFEDAGPINLESTVYFSDDGQSSWEPGDLLVGTGTDLTQSYSYWFGWGTMNMSIDNSWMGLSYADLSLQWTLEGPTWNEQSIIGTGGTGFISDEVDGGLYDLTISSWSLTLIPAPASVLPLVLALGARHRRRRV